MLALANGVPGCVEEEEEPPGLSARSAGSRRQIYLMPASLHVHPTPRALLVRS